MGRFTRSKLSPRVLGAVLVVAGLVLAGLSLSADAIGIGATGSSFGYKQFLGTVIGLALVVTGVTLFTATPVSGG